MKPDWFSSALSASVNKAGTSRDRSAVYCNIAANRMAVKPG
jgi:hypothetical protein